MAKALTFYFRDGCSLCEAMLDELAPYLGRIQLTEVDVDRSPELAERWGQFVPALVGENGELCRFFLDPDVLERYLSPP